MADHTGAERSELNRLQQEAIRRAREMQARAQVPPHYAPRPAPGGEEQPRAPREEPARQAESNPPPPPPPQKPPEATPPAPHPSSPAESFLGGISGSLDFLLKDTERSMLLILLLILMEEKADTSLIFAMMYLLI